jgi:hypothetical protein
MATQMNYSLSIGFSNSKKALESGIRILSSHLEVGENGAPLSDDEMPLSIVHPH